MVAMGDTPTEHEAEFNKWYDGEHLPMLAAVPGDIVHLDGRVLGRHEGVTRYTIGQRRGLNVAVGDPLFVVRIDADARQVIVGPRMASQPGSGMNFETTLF